MKFGIFSSISMILLFYFITIFNLIHFCSGTSFLNSQTDKKDAENGIELEPKFSKGNEEHEMPKERRGGNYNQMKIYGDGESYFPFNKISKDFYLQKRQRRSYLKEEEPSYYFYSTFEDPSSGSRKGNEEALVQLLLSMLASKEDNRNSPSMMYGEKNGDNSFRNEEPAVDLGFYGNNNNLPYNPSATSSRDIQDESFEESNNNNGFHKMNGGGGGGGGIKDLRESGMFSMPPATEMEWMAREPPISVHSYDFMGRSPLGRRRRFSIMKRMERNDIFNPNYYMDSRKYYPASVKAFDDERPSDLHYFGRMFKRFQDLDKNQYMPAMHKRYFYN